MQKFYLKTFRIYKGILRILSISQNVFIDGSTSELKWDEIERIGVR